MTGVLIRQLCENRNTVRKQCDHEGRVWSYRATSQGKPQIAGKPPEARKRRGRIPPQVSEGVWPC